MDRSLPIGPSTDDQRLPRRQILACALCAGLATGLGVALLVCFKWLIAPWLNNFIISYLTPDVVWMAPLANAVLFAMFGIGYVTLSWVVPALRRSRVVAMVFLFLTFYSLLLLVPDVFHVRLHAVANVLLALGLASIPAFARGLRGWSRRPKLVWLGAAAACLVFGVGWLHQEFRYQRALATLPAAPVAAEQPNVLLITLDTVRAQNMSLHGYSRPTTPFLDRLASQGVAFENLWSTSPWTLPAHATMFTGYYPDELSADFLVPLADRYLTLAEAFGRAGYETAGVVANYEYCGRNTGLDRGFAWFDDYPRSFVQVLFCTPLGLRFVGAALLRPFTLSHAYGDNTAEEMNARLLRWLDHRPDPDRRFFAFVNYIDAHNPYVVPRPHNQQFAPLTAAQEHRLINPDMSHLDTHAGSADMRLFERSYDDCLTYLDQQLEALFAELERRGALNNTLVIVTSDHGEQFGDHDLAFHHNSLYRPLLHVPMVVVWPGHVPAGVRVADHVSLRSLPATIVDLAGLDNGEPQLPGRSLQTCWNANAEDRRYDPIRASVRRSLDEDEAGPAREGDMVSVVADGLQLIVNRGNGLRELYDLVSDPRQEQNLASLPEFRTRTAQLEAALNGGPATLRRPQPILGR